MGDRAAPQQDAAFLHENGSGIDSSSSADHRGHYCLCQKGCQWQYMKEQRADPEANKMLHGYW
jgi:hypothetical protein